jgi:peroxiredoxin
MAIPKSGAPAPEIALSDTASQRRSLGELRSRGPVLLAFFKVTCPTCQYAMPFLQRLREQTPEASLAIIGVSQDNVKKTEAFHSEYGVRFPSLVDPAEQEYPASNAYGITHVPSLFLVEPDGKISLTSVGFVKADFEELSRRFGARMLFADNENVPAFRAG